MLLDERGLQEALSEVVDKALKHCVACRMVGTEGAKPSVAMEVQALPGLAEGTLGVLLIVKDNRDEVSPGEGSKSGGLEPALTEASLELEGARVLIERMGGTLTLEVAHDRDFCGTQARVLLYSRLA